MKKSAQIMNRFLMGATAFLLVLGSTLGATAAEPDRVRIDRIDGIDERQLEELIESALDFEHFEDFEVFDSLDFLDDLDDLDVVVDFDSDRIAREVERALEGLDIAANIRMETGDRIRVRTEIRDELREERYDLQAELREMRREVRRLERLLESRDKDSGQR